MELLAGFEPTNIGFAIRRLWPDLATVAYKMQDDEALTTSCGAHINLYTAPLSLKERYRRIESMAIRAVNGGSGGDRTLDTYIKSVVPYRLATLP